MKTEKVDIRSLEALKQFADLIHVTITNPQGRTFEVSIEGNDEQRYVLRFTAVPEIVEVNNLRIQSKAILVLDILKVTGE